MTATGTQMIEVVPAVHQTGQCVGFTADGGNPPDRDTFHVSFDPGEDVEVVIVEAVAAIHNTEPDRLEPLATAVDADALNRLVSERESATREITFTYEELEIRLDPDGDLWLTWQ